MSVQIDPSIVLKAQERLRARQEENAWQKLHKQLFAQPGQQAPAVIGEERWGAGEELRLAPGSLEAAGKRLRHGPQVIEPRPRARPAGAGIVVPPNGVGFALPSGSAAGLCTVVPPLRFGSLLPPVGAGNVVSPLLSSLSGLGFGPVVLPAGSGYVVPPFGANVAAFGSGMAWRAPALATRVPGSAQAAESHWMCPCGFRNRDKNTHCGGSTSMGCKAPNPGGTLDATTAAIAAFNADAAFNAGAVFTAEVSINAETLQAVGLNADALHAACLSMELLYAAGFSAEVAAALTAQSAEGTQAAAYDADALQAVQVAALNAANMSAAAAGAVEAAAAETAALATAWHGEAAQLFIEGPWAKANAVAANAVAIRTHNEAATAAGQPVDSWAVPIGTGDDPWIWQPSEESATGAEALADPGSVVKFSFESLTFMPVPETRRGAVVHPREAPPCQFFMAMGECKLGDTCKYSHDTRGVRQVLDGILQEEGSWKCPFCEFTNRPNNERCGGNGVVGCKQPRLGHLAPWFCACGWKNRAMNNTCGGGGPKGCKALRPEGPDAAVAFQSAVSSPALGINAPEPETMWHCAACGFRNRKWNDVCGGVGGKVGCRAPKPMAEASMMAPPPPPVMEPPPLPMLEGTLM